MWDSFWPDVIVAFIGAVLTIVIALFTYLIRTRQRENQALRGLIRELHRRRAISDDPNQRLHLFANRRPDFGRVVSSVISMRELIKETGNRVGYSSDLQLVLSDMAKACNDFLEDSERRPWSYDFHAAKLRSRLGVGVSAICRSRTCVAFLGPGDGAISNGAQVTS